MEKTYDITQGSKGIQRVQASPIRAILDRAAVLRGEGNKVIPLSAGEPNFNTPAPSAAGLIWKPSSFFSGRSTNTPPQNFTRFL